MAVDILTTFLLSLLFLLLSPSDPLIIELNGSRQFKSEWNLKYDAPLLFIFQSVYKSLKCDTEDMTILREEFAKAHCRKALSLLYSMQCSHRAQLSAG
jgi:hypothetical protein